MNATVYTLALLRTTRNVSSGTMKVVENSRREMQRILAGTPEDQPFFFVFGSINVHRPYTPDSGKELWGIEP